MSKANTIPEFLGILVGTIAVFSVGGMLISMAFEGATKSIKNITKNNDNDKTTTKLKIIPDTFITDKNLIKQDPIRYMTGSPGEVTRILTQNYYALFFNETKNSKNALEFLEYRAGTFNAITGNNLKKDCSKTISNRHFNKISTLIFFLCYHENFNEKKSVFAGELVGEVYKIIIEEHNKFCPKGQEEINEFKWELLYEIKNIYSKCNEEGLQECSIDPEEIDIEEKNLKMLKILTSQRDFIDKIIATRNDKAVCKNIENTLNNADTEHMTSEESFEIMIKYSAVSRVTDYMFTGLDEKAALEKTKKDFDNDIKKNIFDHIGIIRKKYII